jgi:SAM-dependent methyltransferase
MSNLTDPGYLKNHQYQDSRNLAARAALHDRFSTNPIGWQTWVFDQLQLPIASRILEVGCGPAYLWQRSQAAVPERWQVVLTDLSRGMLEEAKASLHGTSQFRYTILDASALPFPADFFDGVIANHVLYHLPYLKSALKEIHRVLKPDCCLYAGTNGESHLQEIRQWKKGFLPSEELKEWGTPTKGFNLKNGARQLSEFFKPVTLRLYPDQLEIDQVEPVLRYIESYLDPVENQEPLSQLQSFLEKLLVEEGSIWVSKETGLFLAVKPGSPKIR